MNYNELIKRELLKQIFEKMSDEEKLTFVQLQMQSKNHNEIMDALNRQKSDIEQIKKKQDWKTDFLSDIAANFTTDGIIYLFSRLLRKL